MDKLLLTSVPVDELLSLFDELITKRLKEAMKTNVPEELLSANQVCKLLGITRPTLVAWVQADKIKENRIGSRLFYKRSEIMISVGTITKYKPLKPNL